MSWHHFTRPGQLGSHLWHSFRGPHSGPLHRLKNPRSLPKAHPPFPTPGAPGPEPAPTAAWAPFLDPDSQGRTPLLVSTLLSPRNCPRAGVHGGVWTELGCPHNVWDLVVRREGGVTPIGTLAPGNTNVRGRPGCLFKNWNHTYLWRTQEKKKVLLGSIKAFDLISKLQEIKGTEENRT